MSDSQRIPIDGMTCSSCATRITKAVRKVGGVESVRVDLGADEAIVTFDPARTSLVAIGGAIERAGYAPRIGASVPTAAEALRRPDIRSGLRRLIGH